MGVVLAVGAEGFKLVTNSLASNFVRPLNDVRRNIILMTVEHYPNSAQNIRVAAWRLSRALVYGMESAECEGARDGNMGWRGIKTGGTGEGERYGSGRLPVPR